MNAIPVAGNFTGIFKTTVIFTMLHCLRHYGNATARHCALIGGLEIACAREIKENLNSRRALPRGEAALRFKKNFIVGYFFFLIKQN